jgi:hypothetical protein
MRMPYSGYQGTVAKPTGLSPKVARSVSVTPPVLLEEVSKKASEKKASEKKTSRKRKTIEDRSGEPKKKKK